MPITDPGFTWQEALWAFGVIAVVAFLVTWVLTDLLRIPRTPYIAMLFVAALGLGAGYCAWSGTSAGELFTSAVGWALIAGLVAATIAVPLVRHLPAHPHATGSDLVGLHAVGNAPKMVNAGEPHPGRVSSFDKDGSSGPHTERARMVAPVQFPAPRRRPARRVSLTACRDARWSRAGAGRPLATGTFTRGLPGCSDLSLR